MTTATPVSGFHPAATQLAFTVGIHAASDVHAVHGMRAMHRVRDRGTAQRLITLSGQAPDQLPTLVPYARNSDRRSTELPRASPRKSTTSKRGGRRRVLLTTGLEC